MSSSAASANTSSAAALAVIDRFLAAFNARDARLWSETLHFPHVRLAAGQVQVWQTADEYVHSNDLDAFAGTGWSHSRWDDMQPVQAGADKVHVAVQFTRYDAAEQPIGTFRALYVVTQQQGRWGVQLRSSFAGVTLPGAAF